MPSLELVMKRLLPHNSEKRRVVKTLWCRQQEGSRRTACATLATRVELFLPSHTHSISFSLLQVTPSAMADCVQSLIGFPSFGTLLSRRRCVLDNAFPHSLLSFCLFELLPFRNCCYD